jgi:lipopolysaccharide transport system permease protein
VVNQINRQAKGDFESLKYYGQPDPLGLRQLKEAWDSRELLLSFFQRDLLIRYRQVFIGVLWVLVQPILGTLIFLLLFYFMGARKLSQSDATVFWQDASVILLGILMWQLVNNSLRDATGSLVNYRHVITKIYFPRMLLPLSSLLCALFDLAVGGVLLVPLAAWLGHSFHWQTCWAAFAAVLWLSAFCFGAILWLSALNAQYRDVGYILPFLMQIGMFLSPVVYGFDRVENSLSKFWQIVYCANPIASCIGLARWGVLGSPLPPVLGLMLAGLITVVLVVSSLIWFQRSNQWMADRI